MTRRVSISNQSRRQRLPEARKFRSLHFEDAHQRSPLQLMLDAYGFFTAARLSERSKSAYQEGEAAAYRKGEAAAPRRLSGRPKVLLSDRKTNKKAKEDTTSWWSGVWRARVGRGRVRNMISNTGTQHTYSTQGSHTAPKQPLHSTSRGAAQHKYRACTTHAQTTHA